jgi:hypothetical protein
MVSGKAWWVALGAAVLIAVAFACSSSDDAGSPFDNDAGGDANGDGAPIDGLQSIDIAPGDVKLVAGDTNQSQAFTATGHFSDGTTKDITGQVTWKAAPDTIISANGPTVVPTGTRGGDATVSAFAGSITGTANVHVKWVKTVLANGAAAGSDARFKGAADDPTLAPTLAYPLDGALVPPNLPPMEIQFGAAAGTDLFDVAIAADALDAHIITPCVTIGTNACGLLADAATWSSITSTLGGNDPASVVVHAAGATAGKIGSSAPASLQVAGEDLRGGLYYFNTRATAPDKPGIYRYDFVSAKVGSFFTQGDCAGCHALSLDGTKMLAPICDPARPGCERPLQLAVVDVATKQFVTPPMPVGDSDTQTWSPDNNFYVTTPSCGTLGAGGACATYSGGVMTLVSAAANTAVGPVPAQAGAMYPSFSNDGKKLIYARAGTYNFPLEIHDSSIYWLPFDGSKTPPTWGAESALVTASGTDHENNYHPSFSPDDKWVVFSRSHCEAGDDPAVGDLNANVCDSYNDTTARSWIVSAGGGAAIELAKLNGTGRNTVSWPKWSPFKTTYKGGDLFWITVATTRDYGFRATHAHDAKGNPTSGVTQLWLVAFDPARAAAGKDPSFAPVWLPFQDVQSSNHIGQWATKIVGPVN